MLSRLCVHPFKKHMRECQFGNFCHVAPSVFGHVTVIVSDLLYYPNYFIEININHMFHVLCMK